MKYFRVKQTSDQINTSIRFKNNFLIANELFTIREVDKSNETREFIHKHLELIEVSKKQTYFFFGARFTKSISNG